MVQQGQVFKLRRRGEALVQAGGVVPADVLDHGELELRAGPPDAVGDQLGLEAVDERLGEGAKSRCTRSGRRTARGSGVVVRHGLPRRFAPTIPLVFISRCTLQRGTRSPARRSATHIRR